MTEKQKRVIDFIPDLPLHEHECAFNVLARQGKHRQCSKNAREEVEGYRFCKRHAEFVKKELRRG